MTTSCRSNIFFFKYTHETYKWYQQVIFELNLTFFMQYHNHMALFKGHLSAVYELNFQELRPFKIK